MPRKDPNGNDIGTPRKKPQTDAKQPRWSPKTNNAAEWSTVDPKLIARVVVAVTAVGDAVMFGQTSDGGALVLNILSDPPTPKTYFKPSDDVDYTLTEIALAYEDEN